MKAWRAIKEWCQGLIWSMRWERDVKWRKHTTKRLDQERAQASLDGKKFKTTALRRFVEKQPKEKTSA